MAERLKPGQRLGRYRVIAPLGRGGMAAVYRVEEASLGREVALKVLPAELMEEPGFLERFEREGRVIAQLEHPNIVPLYASGIDDGIPWMALRLLTHGTLQDRLQAGDLGFEEGLKLFGQVARALDHAHAKGVLHRDLKPQNVLLGTDASAYLADFGIARILSGRSDLTATGMMLGTPSYMAPEQAQGQTLTPACDYYALAVMLYRWLCGQVPFDADTPLAVMMKHAQDPVPLEPMRGLPEPVRDVLIRGLSKAPEDRGSSAIAMVQALAPPLRDSAPPTIVQARPVKPDASTRRAEPSDGGAGPTRRLALIAPAIIAMLLALAGGWFWMSRATDDAPPLMVGAEGDPADEAGTPLAELDQGPTAGDRIELERPRRPSNRPVEENEQAPLSGPPAELPQDAIPGSDQEIVFEEAPETPEPLSGGRQIGSSTPMPDEPIAEEVPPQQPAEDEPTTEIQAPRPAGARFRDCPECPEMVVIPAGRFVMGSPADEAQRQATEGPQREVEVKRFALAVSETRFAEWDLCLAEGGCSHRPDDNGWGSGEQPVIDVSWNDARDYLAWLSAHTGHRYRLPSEAEWEYAARAGTAGRHYLGDCFDSATANFDARRPAQGCPAGDFLQRPLPVASFPANPFGLHDMHGNVWEWVQDCANANYQGAPTDGSAWMRGDCNRGTVRGGAWHDWGFWLRAAARYSFPRDSRHAVGGFRVARELP